MLKGEEDVEDGEEEVPLILLAANSRTRVEDLPFLAPVERTGAGVLHLNIESALLAGFTRVLVVVRAAAFDRIVHKVFSTLSTSVRSPRIRFIRQYDERGAAGPGIARPLGTVQTVLAARVALDSAPCFAVGNADHLYSEASFRRLLAHLRVTNEHALVAFPVARTLLGTRPVARDLCMMDTTGLVTSIAEGVVRVGKFHRLLWTDGREEQDLRGDEPVSMNLWAFGAGILPELAASLRPVPGSTDGSEALSLTQAVNALADRHRVRVLLREDACFSITDFHDAELLRIALRV